MMLGNMGFMIFINNIDLGFAAVNIVASDP